MSLHPIFEPRGGSTKTAWTITQEDWKLEERSPLLLFNCYNIHEFVLR